MKTIRENVKDNKDFLALLVTPSAKLLWGKDKPNLVIAQVSGYKRREKEICLELKGFAREMGYRVGRL